MLSPRELLDRWKKEFETHQQTGTAGSFNASADVGQGVAKMVRGLEERRQTGALTADEQGWLRETDGMLEKISSAAKAGRTSPPAAPRKSPFPQVYQIGSEVRDEEEPTERVAYVPNISGEQADQIIADLDKQFEEKVMAKLRERQTFPKDPGSDFGSVSDLPPGRSLGDHAGEIRNDLPTEPFADEDSKKDLSHRIKQRS